MLIERRMLSRLCIYLICDCTNTVLWAITFDDTEANTAISLSRPPSQRVESYPGHADGVLVQGGDPRQST